MRRFDFLYNGVSAWDYGVAVTTRPDIPAPQLRGSFVQIAGRDGELFETDGTYDNIEIPVKMNYVRAPHKTNEAFRRIKNWLSGHGELTFSDDSEVFFKVKNVNVTKHERKTKFGANLEAEFTCDPFTYYHSGKTPKSPEEVRLNPYYTAQPIYIVTGQGQCELTVNGNTMSFEVVNELRIDTSLMITFMQGIPENQIIEGANYDEMYLQNGENEISITQGFDLAVIPNWRSR